MRRSTRHPVDYRVIGEHRQRGDIQLHIVNISAHGFMVQDEAAPAGADNDGPETGGSENGKLNLGRGERVVIRLPHVGRIEAHLIWASGDRAGFQFERIIRAADFVALIDTLQPNPRLRGRR